MVLELHMGNYVHKVPSSYLHSPAPLSYIQYVHTYFSYMQYVHTYCTVHIYRKQQSVKKKDDVGSYPLLPTMMMMTTNKRNSHLLSPAAAPPRGGKKKKMRRRKGGKSAGVVVAMGGAPLGGDEAGVATKETEEIGIIIGTEKIGVEMRAGG